MLLEEIGRSLTPGPFFSTVVLGGFTVLDAGTDAQKQHILPGVCSGQTLMTLALTEASATYEPWGIETTATREGDGFPASTARNSSCPMPTPPTCCWWRPAPPQADDPAQGISLFFVNADTPGADR